MKKIPALLLLLLFMVSCGSDNAMQKKTSLAEDPSNRDTVRLITVDPGHFHAALVQKIMYPQVARDVYVYAPQGPDCDQHLNRIKSYNSRKDNPTAWNEIVYNGPDFFEKMLAGKKGNVVVLSGNNRKKAEYISKSINAGLNVLADKPMIINADDFPILQAAFDTAKKKGVLLYDIMTERFEVTTRLQKLLSQNKDVFGTLMKGTSDEPAVSKISVHHFSKIVSGSPLQRPGWFFDVRQQGEGIVDVTTHLVDLVQWECFPEQLLSTSDISMKSARRWSTAITKDEFAAVTGLKEFPDYLKDDVKDGKLNVFSNGEMVYSIKGVFAKVSVEWKYQAPAGGGDTHFSVMHGSNSDLVIRQGAEEKYIPTLYIENIKTAGAEQFKKILETAFTSLPYDSLGIDQDGNGRFKIIIPAKYRVSHEEHFGQVTSKFLEYLKSGKLPEWEIQGMLTKYYTTTSALKLAGQNSK